MFNVDVNTTDKERHGTWGDFMGSQFLIAHVNNPTFQRELSRLQLPHRKAIDKGKLDPDTSLEIMSKAMAKGLLLDWRDVIDADENRVSYSQDMAYRVLKGNSALREFVTEYATDLSNFYEETQEDLGKSSEESSAGTPSGVTKLSSSST